MTSTLMRIVRAPWSAWQPRDLLFLAAGLPLCIATLTLMALPWVYFIPVAVTAVLATVAASFVLPSFVLSPLTALQRLRFASLLEVNIPPTPRRERGLERFVPSETTARRLGYHTVVAPLIGLGAVLTIAAQAAGVVLVTFYIWIWAVPVDTRTENPGYTTTGAYLTGLGVILLLAVRRLPAVLTRLDVQAATALLGPSRALQLEQRVEDLTERRAGVVDAADAERRRIERDLHDGAQQRLVSLAMNLGLAQQTLTGLPDDARQVIEEAHKEAKEALTELRNLVRGLHPAVLDDRGLDAALSGIAARAPLPVRLSVDVARRASPTVEAVAYFVASEALANVSKHAGASQVEMVVQRHENVLHVIVTDDGIGGADPSRGSGLAGLMQRVGSVDGTFRIESPVGGPTIISVELPCEQ
jgi:signal transduction histidine kinase